MERAGGSGLLNPSCETACEETREVAGGREGGLYLFSGKLRLSVCEGYVSSLAHCYIKEFICDEFCEKRTLHGEN